MEFLREQFNQVARAIAELARRVRRLETLANFAPITQTVEGAVEEGPGIDIPEGTSTVGLGGDSILVYHANSTPVSEFPPTEPGIAAAFASLKTDDVVVFPKNISIACTRNVDINKVVYVYDINLTFSGFSGAGLTISAAARLYNARSFFNGTGQAQAIAIDATSSCKLYQSGGTARSATSTIGIRANGIASYQRAHIVDCIGDARDGATNIGLDLEDYSLTQNSLGFAANGSVNDIGIQFDGTGTGEDGAFALACTGATQNSSGGRGGLVPTGKFGRAIGCSFVSDDIDLFIASGATLEGNGNTYQTITNNGTLTYLLGDRVPLKNYYTDTSETVTLSTDVLQATRLFTIVAAETGTTDDLSTINFGTAAKFLVLQADAGDTITIKHGVGNINLNSAADFELSGEETLLLWYDGTNWADVGAGGAGHAAVTLAADADTVLSLTGQEIGLDTQSANQVWAGPTSGAAADPSFRAIVAADVGSGTPDGTKFLRDDMSWQVPAGGSGGTDVEPLLFSGW